MNVFLYFLLAIKQAFIYSTPTNDNNDDNLCPLETPLLIKNSSECVYEKFDQTKHEISNKITRTQWLNKINILGELTTWFIGIDFSSKGDLIIQSINYQKGQLLPTRYFYGIKANGRALFYVPEDNKFTNQISIISTTIYQKFESEFVLIKLNNDEKDYYLSPCFKNNTIEIIDFYENKVIGVPQANIFGDSLCISIMYSIIQLKNENKTYMFCFIADNNSVFYISFQKFIFKDSDLTKYNSYEKTSFSQFKPELKVHTSNTISCIEIIKYNIIQCFYLNTTNYFTLGLFDIESLDYIYSEAIDDRIFDISETTQVDTFYQSILFKKEISILGYFLGDDKCIYIQMKEIIYNKYFSKYEIEDYLINYKQIEIKLENVINFDTFYYLSQLKKINDNKFSLVSPMKGGKEILLFIFELYSFHDTCLFIRYYKLPVKFYDFYVYRYLRSVNYYGFLGLVYTITIIGTDRRYQRFSILSYINSTDSELINLEKNTFLNLSDYINEDNLENNVFGVDLYGIKIQKLPKTYEVGLYYFSKLNNNIVYENDILLPNDEIYFVFDYDIIGTDNNIYNNIYTIEMAGVGIEKEYSESLEYIIHSEIYGNSSPESSYKRKIFVGRTSFYNFTISNSINGNNDNSCIDNCKVCSSGICIKCINGYKLIEDTNSNSNYCQLEAIQEGYYYDENNRIYRRCHEYCLSCYEGPKFSDNFPEIEDTNCKICIDTYYKIENSNNCININNIPETYYFDPNKELVSKCFENCKTCNKKPINSTYYSCLSCDDNSILYEKSANCLNCFIRGKYSNHYENECIDFIPEGYYLEDETNKAIAKCYFSCKNCSEGGDKNNHRCISCGENYIYRNKEGTKCLMNCSGEYLYTDIETKRCYNDCIDNIITERIYNYKNICLSLEDKPNNYEVIDNNFVKICDNLTDYFFNNKCYESCPENTKLKINDSNTSLKICICDNLYYLNGEDQVCIIGNECPNEYPYLKPDSFECYKCPFLYKGECYSACPNNTYIDESSDDNSKICVDIIIESENIIIKTEIEENNKYFDFSKYLEEIKKLNLTNSIVINDYQNISINIYLDGVIINEITQIYPNLTFISLQECGKELKKFYNLDSNENLYIVTFESSNDIKNRVTNKFNFEIYLKNGTELEDLLVCNNLFISVSSAISKLDIVNYDQAKIFNSQGYNIYDKSSGFYNEKCSPANIYGNDIIIRDREEDIFPHNASFCSNGCELNNVEIESKRVNCSCNIDYNEQEKFLNNTKGKLEADEDFFIYVKDNINYKIFQCYHILLNLDFIHLVNNFGFLFGLAVISFFIVCFFIFFFVFLPRIRIQIFKLIPNKDKLTKKLIERRKKTINTMKYIKRDSHLTRNMTNVKRKITIKNTKKIVMISLNKNGKSQIISEKTKNTIKYSAPIKRKSQVSEEILFHNKNENEDNLNSNKGKKIDDIDLNFLPYTMALRLDKRDVLSTLISLLKMKIEIIPILFFPEEFTHKSITLSVYLLDLYYSLFINSFLYTDDIISEKYHNNGQLKFYTSMFLSLSSNIVSFLLLFYIKKIVSYREFFSIMIRDITNKENFVKTFTKIYLILKVKIIIFFIIAFITSIFIMLYITVFCGLYPKTQVSLIENYSIGFIESLIYSLAISFLICTLRHLGLKFKIKYFYRTSVCLDNKF